MWPRSWGKFSRGATAVASPARRLSHFSFSSFKDVHALLRDEEEEEKLAASAVFHRVRVSRRSLPVAGSAVFPAPFKPAAEEKRIVLYFTSLRVVRATFEDCRAVRSILRGFRVAVDERDLSMDSAFLAELQTLLGRCQLELPRVFVGGRDVGGAEEIRQLHESGELRRIVEGAQPAAGQACQLCGGASFVLCDACSGSRKLFSGKGSGFRSCAACNENGLLRCPLCCPATV